MEKDRILISCKKKENYGITIKSLWALIKSPFVPSRVFLYPNKPIEKFHLVCK